jgi:phage/plasmid-like protein (TIGR03299 family)
MAHEVDSMMFAGEAPWHGLGVRVPHEVTSEEAIRHAGLDWKVATTSVLAVLGGDREPTPVPRARAVVRQSDGTPLGIVGERYRPIQNAEAFAFFDEVVGEGQAIYHTAGGLNGGRRVWILAKLPGEIRVGGDDVTEKYLLLSNSHDGTSALRMLFTPVRVVCQNTLNIALRRGVGQASSIRHTASAPLRIDEARRVLGLSTDFYDEFADTAARLGATRYSDANMWELVKECSRRRRGSVASCREHARQGRRAFLGRGWARGDSRYRMGGAQRSRRVHGPPPGSQQTG